MGNLQQAIAESQLQTPKLKSGGIRIADHRTLRQLLDVVFAGISKTVSPTAWAEQWLQSGKFYLTEVPANIACPTPKNRATNFLGSITAAAEAEGAIVIDVNKARVGQTAGGFLPQVVVVRGHNRYLAEKAAGKPYIKAWVGNLAAARLNLIYADNQFGANELRTKLQDALEAKYPGKKLKGSMAGIDWKTRPSIAEVYPLENYLVYSKDDNMYKHTYTADQSKRTVVLTGSPQEVKQKYVDINASSVVKMGTVGLDAAGMTAPFAKRVKAGLTPVRERDSIPAAEAEAVGRPPFPKKKVAANTDFAIKKRNKTRPNQPTFPEKTRGGTKSELAEVMSARTTAVNKIFTRFKAAVAAGYAPGNGGSAPAGMEAVAEIIGSALRDKGKGNQIATWLKNRKK